jgi:hypothetical protein
MSTTLIKLAFAGVRSRLLASALTVLLSSAAAATIVLALEVGATARDPWQRTFTAANGAHVLANVPSQAEARAIAALPGVAERDEPVPIANVAREGTDRLLLAGLPARPRVNTPVRTAGSALREDGVVLERSFAEAEGLEVGTPLALSAPGGPIELPILGTAISPSQPRYPRSNPGLAWVTRATLERIEPDRSRWSWTQAVRLTDAAAAPAFAARATASLPAGSAFVATWQDQRAEALRDAQPAAIILTTYTIVLLVVVFAVVAILIGARASAQHREIGLLKAVGLTPRQITTVFTLESAALGLIAVVIGFALGALLAPRIAAPSAETMLGAPTTAANPWHLLAAGIPVLLVLIASARSSTRRATRFSALQAIQAGTRAPAPRSRLARTLAGASLRSRRAPRPRLHPRRRAPGDHRDDPHRDRAAVRTRAHPRLRRSQGGRPHAQADRLEPRRRPRRRGAGRRAHVGPAGHRPLPHGLWNRRWEQRGPRDRPVVVARARSDRNRDRGRRRHEPPGPPRDAYPHRRRAPLRMNTAIDHCTNDEHPSARRRLPQERVLASAIPRASRKGRATDAR